MLRRVLPEFSLKRPHSAGETESDRGLGSESDGATNGDVAQRAVQPPVLLDGNHAGE